MCNPYAVERQDESKDVEDCAPREMESAPEMSGAARADSQEELDSGQADVSNGHVERSWHYWITRVIIPITIAAVAACVVLYVNRDKKPSPRTDLTVSSVGPAIVGPSRMVPGSNQLDIDLTLLNKGNQTVGGCLTNLQFLKDDLSADSWHPEAPTPPPAPPAVAEPGLLAWQLQVGETHLTHFFMPLPPKDIREKILAEFWFSCSYPELTTTPSVFLRVDQTTMSAEQDESLQRTR